MSQAPTNTQLSPLHTHTVYSVLDGASPISSGDDKNPGYLEWAIQNGSSGIGVTDHGWQIGNLELYTKCKEYAKKVGGRMGTPGVPAPLPGCEFYVAPSGNWKFSKKPYDYYHITAWAYDDESYRQLIRLGSISFQEDLINGKDRVVKKFGQVKARITFEELFEYGNKLLIGTGCLIGAINKCLLQKEYAGAELNLLRLMEVFKGRMYVEVMPHICNHDYNRKTGKFDLNPPNECAEFPHGGDLQTACNRKNIDLAAKYKLPLLLTVDSHFTTPNLKKVQDVLLQNGDPDGWRFFNSYHMMTTQEAWETYWEPVMGNDMASRVAFTEAVENNLAVTEMAANIEIKDKFHQPEPKYSPEITAANLPEHESVRLEILRAIDSHGRMDWNDPVRCKRLDEELRVILDNGKISFGRYFIFLERWCRISREYSSISAPGRGSAAGCFLAYLLKITHIDPLKYDLDFSRFLSEGRLARGKYPDIDWDQSSKGRELIVALMKQELGDKFAQCSTVGTLKLKSALKDSCRVLLGWNSSDARINVVTKSIGTGAPQGVADKDFLLGYQDQDGIIHESHLHQNPVLEKFFDEYPEVAKMTVSLLGIPRSVGKHASAYLVSDEPISNSVPTCQIGDGITITQYNANSAFPAVEKAGLLKYDLLSVRTLDDCSQAIRQIQKDLGYKVWDEVVEVEGEKFTVTKGELEITQLPMPDGRILDIYNLPEDPEVFKMISDGDTQSLFQINTPTMTPECKRVKPFSVKCLSDLVAGIRPGPLEAIIEDGVTTMWEAYVLRRAGKMATTYAHPGMEALLKDSYGVALYQEDLQAMFRDLAGYSAPEADELREILAKKQRAKMEAKVVEIRGRLKDRNWNDAQAQVFINLVVSSASYAFNRSHSYSYAVVSYITAYLKFHFPTQWWASVLTNASMEDIRSQNYARELRHILQLPHVNGPTEKFDIKDEKVHAPLYIIDGLGPKACLSIRNARQKGGDFKNLQDFFERAKVDQGVMHNLIICGAFGLIEPDRGPKELIEDYHYLRRVTELKIGRGKSGDELFNAVIEYRISELEKGKKLDIPELYKDRLQLEIARLQSLPIYRINVHEDFKDTLSHRGVMYDVQNATYRSGISSARVYRNVKEISDDISNPFVGTVGIWAGIIQDSETFQYSDRKTGNKVTALKLAISNDGDAVECVVWPNLYEKMGDYPRDRIVLAIGKIKESRDPGKWSLSVEQLKFL